MCVYTVLNLGHVCVWWRGLRLRAPCACHSRTRAHRGGWGIQELSHILGSKGLGTGGSGRGDSRDMKSLVWAIKAEGWWSRKGLSGVDVAYIEEGKAPARWQDSVPPGQICFGLSLSPHPEHRSSARDSCASLITVLLLESQAEGGQAISS